MSIFNISPSTIGFLIAHYCYLSKKNHWLLIFGFLNHLVILIYFYFRIIGFYFDKKKILILVLFVFFLAFCLIFNGNFFFQIIVDFFLEMKSAYMLVEGNHYHVIFAITLMFFIFLITKSSDRFFQLSLAYIIIIIFSYILFGSKLSSRIAFGADLLFLHFF